MLVLSRKKLESIRIGNDIEIIVLSVEGETVKIGISAPKQVTIHRQEVYAAIMAENQQALDQKLLSPSLLPKVKKPLNTKIP